MVLGKCFEKFLERSPVSVMVRGTLERVFNPERKEAHWGKRKLKRDQ